MLLFAFLACDNQRTVDVRLVRSKEPAIPAIESSMPPNESELTWTIPKSWVVKPATGMRLVTFVIPDSENQAGVAAEGLIVKLSGQAGGIVSNVNRWREELGLASLNEQEISKLLRSDTGKLGTFHWVLLENPAPPQTAIWAAIIPYPNSTLFVKWVGLKKTIEAHRASFVSFAKSIHPSA